MISQTECGLRADIAYLDSRLLATGHKRTHRANLERPVLRRLRAAKAGELVRLLAAPLVRKSKEEQPWGWSKEVKE